MGRCLSVLKCINTSMDFIAYYGHDASPLEWEHENWLTLSSAQISWLDSGVSFFSKSKKKQAHEL